jgi:hypothetical protein
MFKQLQEFLELSGYKRAREDLSYAVINYYWKTNGKIATKGMEEPA